MFTYAGTYKAICGNNLVYNFLIQLLPLQSPVFVVYFSNAFWHGKETFPKGSSQNQIFSLLIIFHLPYSKYRNMKTCFYSLSDQNQIFFHSCRTCVVPVAIMWYLCRTCVARVSLVSLVSVTRVANCCVVAPCCGTVVQWLPLLHNFIQQSLNSGSAEVQILLAACRRFAMMRISDNGLGWK